MGIWDTITDIFTGKPAKDAAEKNAQFWQANQASGNAALSNALTQGTGALNQAGDFYKALSGKYGAGTNLYLDALGVNGPEAAAAAKSSFTTTPGYDFTRDEALKAVERSAAGRGILNSGNTLTALQDRASNLANQEYTNWLSALGGLISPEVTGVSGQAGAQTALAGLYADDAKNRINLGNTTTTGQTNANNQSANAQLGSSANLWNLGLGAAKLAAGFI